VGFEATQDLNAIRERQLQVQQNQLGKILLLSVTEGAGAENEFQGFRAVASYLDLVGQLVLPEGMKRQLHVVRIGFHMQAFDSIARHDALPSSDRCNRWNTPKSL